MALQLYLGRVAVDADMSVGSHVVATNIVTSGADVGRYCDVIGAGAGGSTLVAVITAVGSGTVTLGYAASTAVTDSTVVIWVPYNAGRYSISGDVSSLTGRPNISFDADRAKNSVVPAVGTPVLLLDLALVPTPPSASTAGDIFGGYVSEVDVTNIAKTNANIACLCVSWEALASERTTAQPNDGIDPINGKFSGEAAGAVFQWLADNILDSDISQVSVVTGPTIDEISFDYTALDSAFDSICQAATNDTDTYIWRMDARRNLYFELQTTNAAPWNISNSDALTDYTVKWTDERYANVAFVTPKDSTGDTIDNALVKVTQNNTAIDARAAIRGGTGRSEVVVAAGDRNSSMDAQTLADSIAESSARIPNTVEYGTYRGGLVAGQLQNIVITDKGVSANFLIVSVNISMANGRALWRVTAVNGALIGDYRTALANLAGGGSGFGGAGGGSGSAGPAMPPGVDSVSAPVITTDDKGNVLLAFEVTYPDDLGTMTHVYVRVEAPYAGVAVDSATNVPPTPNVYEFGPFPLTIVGGAVTNTQTTVTVPLPAEAQTWAAWFTTASRIDRNQYTSASAVLVTFDVTPATVVALVPGEEYAPNPANPLGVEIERRVVRGSDQEWRFRIDWVFPDASDPRTKLIAKWDIALFDPTITSTATLEEKIRPLAQLAANGSGRGGVSVPTTSYVSPWLRVPDSAVYYRPMVRPVTADGRINSYVMGVTCSLGVRVAPQNTTAGNEYADVVTGVSAVSGWDFTPTGSREFFIDVHWTSPPVTENRFSGVVINLVSTGDFALPPGQVVTGKTVGESFRLTLSQKDGPKITGTWSVLVFSADANDAVNTYVAGVTPSASFSVSPFFIDAPTTQATGFGVTSAYTDYDYNGIPELSLTVNFTPPNPATDPSWAYVDFWAQRPDDGLWYNYFSPDKSGMIYPIGQLPKATGTWHFLLIDKDTNGKDLAGNSTSDPTAPPAGSATFSLSIAPPALGSANAEYAAVLTSPVGTLGSAVTRPDGTYAQLVTVSATLPTDSRYGGFKVIVKYTSGALNNKFEEIADVPYPLATQDVIWTPPAGSITSTWYYVSYNKLGQLNTIGGGTPSLSKTVGSTSQLDLSASKLASLNTNLLRLNPATGLFEPYNMEQAIYAALQLGGGTANGACNTSGTAVTGTSGSSFTSGMVGLPLFIAGVGYTVQAFTDATHITLSSSAGTQTGAAWSFGRSPQFKLFDRTNTQIGFWGDDSFNTGFVGLFAGKDVRLGGTIGSPVFEVDSAGAVTISGTATNPVVFSIINGTTTLTVDGTDFLKLHNSSSSATVKATGDNITLTGLSSLQVTVTPAQVNAANATVDSTLSAAGLTRYNGAATAGMGVAPIYASVSLTGQTGSIGATSMQVGGAVAPAGIYRISWYGKTTTASGSDTLTVTISYNDGSGSRTRAFGFLLSTLAAGGTQQIVDLIQADGINNIQYSTTRSGATGSPQYSLGIILERLS